MSDISLISRRKFIATGSLALAGATLSYAGVPALQSKSDTLRLGIIGAGTRGTGIARLLKALPGLTVTACCDIQPDNLSRILQHTAPKTKSYSRYDQLLGDKNVDAVIIATPLYLHFPMAKAALDAGKHVYLEKTMTYSIEEALELEKRVKGSGLVLQIGHQYRYFGLYLAVKEAINQKWLGDITHFECQYHRNSDWRFPVKQAGTERLVNWRMYKEYSGGLMAELCGHQIDIVNWIMDGHPLKVTGMGGINFWKDGRETHDHVRATFDYPGGVKANVSSILSNAYHGYEIRILGTKATMQIQRDEAFIYPEATKKATGTVDGVTGATLLNATQGKPIPLSFEHQDDQKRDPTSYALLDFAECIRNKKLPASNVHTGKDAAIAVHMANKAIDTESFQYWKESYDSKS
ncbi:Gfo/Idh/MocA family protein [Desertivirga xinjiangensis]|uniref:Gfo/Idh/MocA family protein n=1 Tax=Desertivirga xinjiangensis TaxID=539206 RepID=UPI00210D290C|nr:Gfo/Idh/MocA family oxidoreductase [Pedobacter xinjiangensis]